MDPEECRSSPDETLPTLDLERWSRLKSIFIEALDRPETAREAFVLGVCGGDGELGAEVLSLLSHDREAVGFWEGPAAALLVGPDVEPAPSTQPRLAPGTRLGVYEISSFLRAGGMGEVYRARHTVLERSVAIKTVGPVADPDCGRRLLREARHASTLKHPNICTIHEVGEAEGIPFIVMELVDGRPLSEILRDGAPELERALDYAVEIADALEHAHRHGIVHRDLKNSNIVVNGSGRPIVLDFGLAKRVPAREGASGGDSITRAGSLAGTLSHMAPEMLRGTPADVRSDVWALGVLLFELTTGALPFAGRTPFETSSAILDEPPRWPEQRIPIALRLVIERCLVKDPDGRYQRAAQVRDALHAIRRRRSWPLAGRLLVEARRRTLYALAAAAILVVVLIGLAPGIRDRLGGSAGADLSTLAFLPLENATSDARLDYYATGLSEGLLAELGAALEIRVVSAGSTGPAGVGSPAAIAGSVGADAVVTGRVRGAPGRLALDVWLIDGASGRVLWSNTFERHEQQVLSLQADVVSGLAAAVRLAVRPEAAGRLVAVRAVNPEAYQAFLKGRYEWNLRTAESLDRALAHFGEARDLDPTYAPAHAALADVYNQFATVLVARGSPREYRPMAEAAAIQALRIDPYSAEAHATLGYVRHYDLRWEEAEWSFLRALELNPSYAMAHLWYANLLMSRRRMEEALDHARMALRLDPYSLIVNANIGWILNASGRPEEALEHLRWTLTLDSTYVQARVRLVGSLVQLGRHAEALHEAERLVELTNRSPFTVGLVAQLHGRLGRPEEARRLLAELLGRARHEYVPPGVIAELLNALGDVDAAVEWMTRAFDERSNAVSYMTLDPAATGMYADPRIQSLVAGLGS